MPTTNFPNGVTNAAPGSAMQTLIQPSNSLVHQIFTDFDDYDATQWTISETGTGTRAVGNLENGILVITNGASNGDTNSLQWSGVTNAATRTTFKLNTNRSYWYETMFKTSDANLSGVCMGLVSTNTTPFTSIADGLYFYKASASTTLTIRSTASSVTTSANVGTLANDTYVKVGLHFDGTNNIYYYLNDVRIGTLIATPTTALLAPTMSIINGEAVAKVLSVDYINHISQRDASYV